MIFLENRNNHLLNSDIALLNQCDITYFKATGKGGQKRNKTSSAVRLKHKELDIATSSSSSRSQHDNKHKALKKMYYQIALHFRSEDKIVLDRFDISLNNKQYHLWVAYVLDELWINKFDTKKTSSNFNISHSKLIKMLGRDNILWQEVNKQRKELNLKQLKL